MTIRFPKVHIDNKQLVYVSFSIEGKRIRLYNGKRINSPIDPNRHPIEQRFEMGKILASDVYKHLLNDGKLLEFRSKKVIAGKLTDIEYLKLALDTKLSGGYSKKYTDMLSYCYRLIHDEIQNSKVDSKAIKNILSRYSSGVSYNTLKRHLKALINEARSQGMKSDPMEGILSRKNKAKLHKPFDDVGAVLDEIKSFNKNLHLCSLLTYGCLLRPHREIRELCWGDISKGLNEIRLSGERNKSGRNRIVPIPSYIKPFLKKDDCGSVFKGFIDPPNPEYFKTLWGRYKAKSKLLKQGQTLYSFRHTGAIEIFKRTGSIHKLQRAMGHSSLNVSLNYLRGLEVVELEESDMPMIC